MIDVKVYVVLKVIKNGAINLIASKNNELDIPNFDLQTTDSLDSQIANFLAEDHNLIYDWLEVRFVKNSIDNNCLSIYYSSFVPEDFNNSSTKFVEFRHLNQSKQNSITDCLRLPAY